MINNNTIHEQRYGKTMYAEQSKAQKLLDESNENFEEKLC